MLRFVHTGDWQLGMRRHFLSPEAQARYDEARLEAVRAIARVAVGEGCGFVVVAGDVFDSNFVDRQVFGRALEALRAFTVPVYLLPGNHDALDAASVYRRPSFAERRPPLVRVLERADPVSVPGIDEAVEVVGVPWRTRRPSEDLVGLACAGLGPPRGLRVLVAHGAVDALSPDGADPARIRLAALEQAIEAGLVHYAALGDRHSVTGVGSTGRVFYAGTPLVTDYDEVEPNHVLVVTLDDGGLAVERRRVGSWSFVSRRIAVDGEEGVDALSASLEAMPDKETSVVELELADELADAEAELGRLCAVHRLDPADPLAEARALVRRRREAEEDLGRSEQVVRENLRDLTEEELANRVRALEARVEAYPRERRAEGPLPPDLPAAEAAEAEASRRLEAAQRDQARAEDAHRAAREARAARYEASVARRVELEATRGELEGLEAQLQAARMQEPDEAVEQALASAQRAADAADAAAQRERQALEAEDPESQRILCANAQGSLERLSNERDGLERRLREVETELRVRGESGLHDQLEDARARRAALERDHEETERRARAAELLFAVLDRRRAQAKARYLGPLRAEIERLGRVVFGPSLSVELDPDTFEVAARTLDDVTVPYESLSTGAKEQLCLLGRLACARLVARGGGGAGTGPDVGVPVVIDDALGYSDPDRLERLGAVLAEAGREAQVLVLTCMPERYRAVGSATVVRLEPTEVRGGATRPATLGGATVSTGAGPFGEPRPPQAVPEEPEEAARVLACLREARTPLGKSEILAATGLDEARWPATVRHLLRAGLVVQEGSRRGARYQPAEP